MSRIVLIVGAPGSGKGTVSKLLEENMSLKTISTGEMLREEIKSGSERGLEIARLIDEGNFVPDKMVLSIIDNFLSQNHNVDVLMFDGYPRNIEQVFAFEQLLSEQDKKIEKVIHLKIPFEIITERIVNREICGSCQSIYNKVSKPSLVKGICDKCGNALSTREDDKLEYIEKRLAKYETTTEPILEFYKDLVVEVDSLNSKTAYEKVLNVLNEKNTMSLAELESLVHKLKKQYSQNAKVFIALDKPLRYAYAKEGNIYLD